MFDALHPSHDEDLEDGTEILREVHAARHVAWLPECNDPDAAWGLETRPLVLFGEAETDALGLPPVDLFVYSGAEPRLWEDLHRCYGDERHAGLRGNTNVYRSRQGNHDSVHVDLTEIVPIRSWDPELSEQLFDRVKAARKWPTREQAERWAAAVLRFECSYGQQHEDEEHLVLYLPHAAEVVLDRILPALACKPDTVLLPARSALLTASIVKQLRPRRLLAHDGCEVSGAYASRRARRATGWGGMRLLEIAGAGT